jgi:hypothetical protein
MTTFKPNGITFAADSATTVVPRANVLMNADRKAMTYEQIEQALYNNKLQASQLYTVTLAYVVDGVVTGVALPDNLYIRLAGQRGDDGSLKGCAPDAHKFVKSQAKLVNCDNIKGVITIGSKHGDFYFGYDQEDTTYRPPIASVSANYEGDAKLHRAITDLIAANPDKELCVYFLPTIDFTKWCTFQRKQAARNG